MKIRIVILIFGATILIFGTLFFLKNLEKEKYKILSKEYLNQNYASDIFSFYYSSGKLPVNNDSLILVIKESMVSANIKSYLKYRHDPFQSEGAYYYLSLIDDDGIYGFVILSAGLDGKIDNENVLISESLNLYKNYPTLKDYFFNRNRDILISHYEFDSVKSLIFKEYKNYWLVNPR